MSKASLDDIKEVKDQIGFIQLDYANSSQLGELAIEVSKKAEQSDLLNVQNEMYKLQETSSDMKDKQTRIFDTLTNLHVNSDSQFDKTDKELKSLSKKLIDQGKAQTQEMKQAIGKNERAIVELEFQNKDIIKEMKSFAEK